MADEVRIFKFLNGKGQPVGIGIEIWIIDLLGIAGKDNFSTLTHTADNGFNFMGGEVLGSIDNHKLMGNTASANLGEGFQHHFSAFHQGL